MGKPLRKQKAKLKQRQEMFDRIPVTKRRGLKRPGSMNPRKGG